MSDAECRERVHDAIQASATDDLDGAMLIGWTCVAEWMDPNGERWISRLSGNAQNDAPPPLWQVQGYLHHALHDDWTEED